jgi:serine protease Do/serine protease DegQ
MGLRDQQTGAVVAKVEPGSAAEHAGLKVGDVITELGKTPIRGSADLRNRIALIRVGDVAELTVLRSGRSMNVRATLAAPPKTLLQGGEISPLLEGASFGPPAAGGSTTGVQITAVQPGSKAAAAGLRKGDVITSVNQQPVARPEEFAARAKENPKRLLLNLLRDGNALFLVLQG